MCQWVVNIYVGVIEQTSSPIIDIINIICYLFITIYYSILTLFIDSFICHVNHLPVPHSIYHGIDMTGFKIIQLY